MTAEQDGTTTIEVRLAIRRDVVASFDLETLSKDTGVPVEVLLTSFDTWDDEHAENFSDYVFDESNYCGQHLGDWSTIEKYAIKEKQ